MVDPYPDKTGSENQGRFCLYLLGPPVLKRENRTVHIERQKTVALLAYLIVTERRHSRDALATLLWPDFDQSHARANLRRCLAELRQIFGRGFIRSEQENLAVSSGYGPWTDAVVFQDLLTACGKHCQPDLEDCPECVSRRTEAVGLYQNDFLFGFSLRDSPEFDRWQFNLAERLREEFGLSLQRLVSTLKEQGYYRRSLDYARKWLALDPLHEPAHRAMMELFARCGQPAAAIRQYRECLRVLGTELSMEPEEETTALHDAIRKKQLIPAHAARQLERKHGAQEEAKPAEVRIITALHIGFGPRGDITWEERIEHTPEAVNPLVTRIREILQRFEARVERLYGEDLLAIFGQFRSHEDDAERAVLAALEIRAIAMGEGFNITTGIHSGAAFVGPEENSEEHCRFVVGPVVNRAARLRYKASDDQILVGESIYQHTRGAFNFESLDLKLGDNAEVLRAYSVVRPRQQAVKYYNLDEAQAQLVGRERELHDLFRTLTEVLRGSGRLVVITGEAGIGKTRLLIELRQAAGAKRHNTLWLEGRCAELSMTTGYGPFLELFQRLFKWHPGDSESERALCIQRYLETIEDRGYLSREQIDEIGPLLGKLLSVKFGNEWDQVLANADSQQVHHRSFQAIRDFVVALSRIQPLILVFEDLHWSDSLSFDLVTLLMESLPGAPILLICLYRPANDHRCRDLIPLASRKCPGSYREITLRELTQSESLSFVKALLENGKLSEPSADYLFQKSLGNPLYLQEIVRSLKEIGTLRFADGVWTVEEVPGDRTSIPVTIQGIVQNRMDRLPSTLKLVLQRAAVIGQSFSREIIEPLGPEGVDFGSALRELTDSAFIFQERSFPEVEYTFRHVLFQEAIYQSIPQKRRSELHRLTAETMERLHPKRLEEYYDRLAYHFSRSDDAEKAVEYLLKAGEKARSSYSNEEACRYFTEALQRLEPLSRTQERSQQQLTACHGLAMVHLLADQHREAEAFFTRAFDIGQNLGLEARELVYLLHGLGLVAYNTNRSEEMIRIGKQGLALLEREDRSTEVALMNLSIARGFRNKRENRQYLEYAKRNSSFIKQLPYSPTLAWPLINIAHSQLDLKNPDTAMNWFFYTEQRATMHNDLNVLAIVRGEIAHHIYRLQGYHQQALEHHQSNLSLDRKIGSGRLAFDIFAMGRNWEYLGELDKALQCYRKALPLTSGRAGEFPGILTKNLGVLLFCMGKREQAVENIHEGYRLLQEVEGEFDPARGKVQIGQDLIMVGEIREGVDILKDALSILKKPVINPTHDQPPFFIRALSSLAEGLNDPVAFRQFCLEFVQRNPEARVNPFRQWYLERIGTPPRGNTVFKETFRTRLDEGWTWLDPMGASSYKVDRGLEIRAANGGEIWRINVSSPRLMRLISGDFSAQTICVPAMADRPAIGGILIWKDRKNFLALVKGKMGSNEITFHGCRRAEDVIVGRGRLAAETLHLRLDRMNDQVRALCGTDGGTWYTVGQTEFSADDPIEVGLYAVGRIQRFLYPGAFPDGSAIRFGEFRLYQ